MPIGEGKAPRLMVIVSVDMGTADGLVSALHERDTRLGIM